MRLRLGDLVVGRFAQLVRLPLGDRAQLGQLGMRLAAHLGGGGVGRLLGRATLFRGRGAGQPFGKRAHVIVQAALHPRQQLVERGADLFVEGHRSRKLYAADAKLLTYPDLNCSDTLS